MRRILKGHNLWAALIVLSIVLSVVVIARRAQIEARNRTVELVMDFDSARALCEENGYDFGSFVSEVKSAGIVSFAVTEQTFGQFADKGHMAIMSGAEVIAARHLGGLSHPLLGRLADKGEIRPSYAYIIPLDAEGSREISDVLPRRLPERFLRQRGADSSTVVEVALCKDVLLRLNMGMPRDHMAFLKAAQVGIVPRFTNPRDMKPETAQYFLDRMKEFGPMDLVLFDGTEVLGYPDHINDIAKMLQEHELAFGRIEFSKQLGDREFTRYMTPWRVIRAHSITRNEVPKFTPAAAVERFLRAVRERDIRVLYIRPLVTFNGDEDPIRGNIDYVKRLSSTLQEQGFALGTARPYADFRVSTLALALVTAGALAGGILLLTELHPIGMEAQAAIFIAGLLAFYLLYSTGAGILARQLAALGAAVVYPSLGAIHVARMGARRPLRLPAAQALLRACSTWVAACLITGIGALSVAGMLSAPSFMIQLDQFAGVKVMHILPLLAVSYFIWKRWGVLRNSQGEGDTPGAFTLAALLARPVLVWHVLAGLLVLLAGAVYIGRTGNTFGIPISGLEETMRVTLERALAVRPRTKEFLLGHPAMVLGAVLILAGGLKERRWAPAFLLLGTIGQLSFVNSFSHIHTPVVVTVLRTFWGGLLGLVFGIILSSFYLWVVGPYLARREGARMDYADRGNMADV